MGVNKISRRFGPLIKRSCEVGAVISMHSRPITKMRQLAEEIKSGNLNDDITLNSFETAIQIINDCTVRIPEQMRQFCKPELYLEKVIPRHKWNRDFSLRKIPVFPESSNPDEYLSILIKLDAIKNRYDLPIKDFPPKLEQVQALVRECLGNPFQDALNKGVKMTINFTDNTKIEDLALGIHVNKLYDHPQILMLFHQAMCVASEMADAKPFLDFGYLTPQELRKNNIDEVKIDGIIYTQDQRRFQEFLKQTHALQIAG